ncbi:hypothetical protein [Acinetobacter guillouiae]|uniref:hypothetical protein n=1 Tax=Acinetobacter guillouiae TaxID=106649 RepID=UPI0028EDFC07|nr:hypothetical protein [Acinetobacter guillouiae]
MTSKEDRDVFWKQHEKNVEQKERAKSKESDDKTKVWNRACYDFLIVRSVCDDCAKRKYTNVAEHVAHIQKPDSQVMFWNINNWQALCNACYKRIVGDAELSIPAPICKAVLETLYTVK